MQQQQQQGFSIEELEAGNDSNSESSGDFGEEEVDGEMFYDARLDEEDEEWVKEEFGNKEGGASLVCASCFTLLAMYGEFNANLDSWTSQSVVNCRKTQESDQVTCLQCNAVIGRWQRSTITQSPPVFHFLASIVLPNTDYRL